MGISYGEGYRLLYKKLPSAFETGELFYFVTGRKRSDLSVYGDESMLPTEAKQLDELLERRLAGEPLQYIVGEWDFYGLTFEVGEGVLIPRSDTEVLVEEILTKLREMDRPEVVDLCAGTGCIAVVLDKFSTAKVTAVEYSKAAFAYLEINSALNESDVVAVEGDALIYQHPRLLDLVVSNPPYIPTEDLDSLQTEVQKEPSMALDGGTDGLDFYRGITAQMVPQLKEGGWLFFEIGIGQEDDVDRILANHGLINRGNKKDLGQIVRIVWGQKPTN